MTTLQEKVGKNFYKLGSSGGAVVSIQIALASLGYPLKGTGYWANATDTAVRDFQKRAGIKIDGVVGEGTARAMDLAASPSTLPIGPILDISKPLWLTAALSYVGTKEFAGSRDNQTIIDWAKMEGGDVAKSYTHDSIPWCALFANHCLTKVGLPGTETLWALDFNSDLMKQRIGHGWPAIRLQGPAVGAFAPMLRNGGGHIIQIVGRAKNGNVMGVGGNQSDAVSVVEFHQDRLNKGFWYPEGVGIPNRIGFDLLPIVNSNGSVSHSEA